jgi:YidC/Oxa1 family membrane protein insertase
VLPTPDDSALTVSVAAPRLPQDVINETKSSRIRIENEEISGTISLKGARFDDIRLTHYKETVDKNSKAIDLLAPSGTDGAYFVEFGWVSSGNTTVTLPNHQSVWTADNDLLTDKKPVTLSWINPQGITFKMQITLDEHYVFNVKQSVTNASNQAITLFPYGLLHRQRMMDKKQFLILHEGGIGAVHGVLKELRYDDLMDNRAENFKQTRGWLGITDKYWLTAIVPSQDQPFDVNYTYTERNRNHHFQADFLGSAMRAQPGESLEYSSHFFAGAKRLKLLEQYQDELGIPLFDRAVDFGWLYFITKPLFKLLHILSQALGSFGLGILALTVLVKLILFPLANKSYVSMHHLKRLHPQLIQLKERYGHDKMRLNQEMMALYKREKVNPMAGCLPILIQLPVFFALYKVLFVTIEMRQAPFYGWISDLSVIDPTNVFNLLGLIPWTPPSFLHIGLWPLIMGATMVLQQHMQPAPADPVQAKVMKILPYIFIFLFASFPAGLVIYWAWNNMLSVLQQWVITRKLPKA